MSREIFTAWVTKYALTEGILKMQVELCADISGTMVSKINGPPNHFHGNDWHRSEADAIKRAEQMRSAKLKSLQKQIDRLRGLSFVKGDGGEPQRGK